MKQHQINLEIQYDLVPVKVRKSIRKAVLSALLNLAPLQELQITVLICDDEYMRNLNLTYRGVDKSTDVLSFENQYSLPDSKALYMGDIAISYPAALRQSTTAGHNIQAEMSLLTVHGVLHLFGYDHQNDNEKKRCGRNRNQILQSLGYGEMIPIGDELNAQE